MAYVIAAPEIMTSAATDLATIGSNVSADHMAAAAPTLAVLPAAAESHL
jgi:PE family